jgi:ribosomal protein S21
MNSESSLNTIANSMHKQWRVFRQDLTEVKTKGNVDHALKVLKIRVKKSSIFKYRKRREQNPNLTDRKKAKKIAAVQRLNKKQRSFYR